MMFLEKPNDEDLKNITLDEFEDYFIRLIDHLNMLKEKKYTEMICENNHIFYFHNMVIEEDKRETILWKCPLCKSIELKVKNELPRMQEQNNT